MIQVYKSGFLGRFGGVGIMAVLFLVALPQITLAWECANASYTQPGTYKYAVPSHYKSLTVTVNGAGGGAAGICYYGFGIGSTAGENSSFNAPIPLVGYGGKGAVNYRRGAPGIATGGQINITGGGALGGYGRLCGSGGNGGQAQSTWTWGASGAPASDTYVEVAVGKGGIGGGRNPYGYHAGASGADGSVTISCQS